MVHPLESGAPVRGGHPGWGGYVDAHADAPLPDVVHRLRGEIDQLRVAMRHRGVIEQAKGALAALTRASLDEAWNALRGASQRHNVKLADVAAVIVHQLDASSEGGTPEPKGARGAQALAETFAARLASSRSTTADSPARHAAARTGGGRDRRRGEAGAGRGQVRRGVASPASSGSPHAPAPPALAGPELSRRDADAALVRYATSSADDFDELLRVTVAECRVPATPTSGVLMVLEADSSLRLISSLGISASTASQWRRIPPTVEIPATIAARTRRPVYVGDSVRAADAYPPLAVAPDLTPGFCNLPLEHRGRLLGVLGLGWERSVSFGPEHDGALAQLADTVADRMSDLLALADGDLRLREDPGWPASPLATALNGILDPALVLRPLFAPGGSEAADAGADTLAVVDFRIDWANDAAARWARRPAGELVGASVLEIHPEAGEGPWWPACLQVVRTGWPVQATGTARTPGHDGRPMRGRVSPLWDGLLVTWHLE